MEKLTVLGTALNLGAIVSGLIIVLAGDLSLKLMTFLAAAWPAVGLAGWLQILLLPEGEVVATILPIIVLVGLFSSLGYFFYLKPYVAPAILSGTVVFIGTAVGCCAGSKPMKSFWAFLTSSLAVLVAGVYAKCRAPPAVDRNLPRGLVVERSCLPSFLDLIASLVGSCFVVSGLMYLVRKDHESLLDIVQDRLLSGADCPSRQIAVLALCLWAGVALLFLFCVRRPVWGGVRRCFRRRGPNLIDSDGFAGCPVKPNTFGVRDG